MRVVPCVSYFCLFLSTNIQIDVLCMFVRIVSQKIVFFSQRLESLAGHDTY